jgi:hypothetical protein
MGNSVSPELQRLKPLIGRWSMEMIVTGAPPNDARGQVGFEWGPEQGFVEQRWEVPVPEAPDGLAVIAADPESGALVQHYFDSRGVVRRYEMTIDGELWTLRRLAPGFNQRFAGRFVDGGATIDGAWEMSEDGAEWGLDFRLVYRRVA